MLNHVFMKMVATLILFTLTITMLAPLISSISLSESECTGNRICSLEQQNNKGESTFIRLHPDGLGPKKSVVQKVLQYQELNINRGYFYAYNAYDPGGTTEGPITFDEPGSVTLLASGIFPNFCAAADMDNEGNWYGCDYAGGLYSIDPDTGTQTFIGSTIGANGMTYDGTTWYVTSANTLYTMDVTTGATTSIGAHGVTNTFIGLACNLDGDMFGYDVLFTGTSTLYSIDKATGTATAVGSMGYGFVYAQDCGFDRDEDILYIAGYFNDGSPSALLTCDYGTGACTPVGNFQGGMEVDGFAVPWLGMQYDDDIAISSIVAPGTGNAGPITPIVNVKNPGLNDEYDVPIQLDIGTEVITGTVEDFEADNGSYTHTSDLPQPDAWAYGTPTSGPSAAHSGTHLWATNLGGNYPASMWCYLITPEFTVPSGAYFNFWHWYYFENNYDGGNVKISNDSGTTWTLITPVGGYPGSMPYNPYMVGEPAFNGQSGGWKQANFDLSAYEGQDCMIMFETASDSSVQYAGWYIDDVGFTITSWQNEYSEIATIPVIYPEETLEVAFPEWTPADLGMVENVNINYNAEATNLFADNNTNNDYKSKMFTLHYRYIHDVAVMDILSPVSGLAVPQIPEVVIENNGQNSESVNVNMNIGKALYTTLLEEDFSSGVPPTGWGTTHPSNWYSSSTNYAGGTAPEAQFSWTPSSVDEFLLYTGELDTTGYTALLLKFKEYVNDYNGDYTLKIVTSTDGVTWNEAWSRAGDPFGPATTEVALSGADGVGSATLQIAWCFSGDSFNINYWYIDDIWMGNIEMIQEYNETAISGYINPGETLNLTLPDWTPADIPFADKIDYLVTATSSLNGSDGDPTNNQQSELITLRYEHDVGVIVITDYPYPYYENNRPPPPDNYSIAGIIGNFGVTYSESDIPVNSIITNDTGIVIYDETVIVADPLAPGQSTPVEFPEFTYPENTSIYGFYRLTMRTQLVGDDHPENDKKTVTWEIPPPPDTDPPVTTATLNGMMGWNDWFVSNVTVTLTAWDYKCRWPTGVNCTYYKIDDSDWMEYEEPFIVAGDGEHTVYFYSDDRNGNVEDVKSIEFRIDQTKPFIVHFTATVQNALKTKWLLAATANDPTSGIVLVEFYADDELVGNVTSPPFEFLIEQKICNAYCNVYDEAGNSQMSDVVTAFEYGNQRQSFTMVNRFPEQRSLERIQKGDSFLLVTYMLQ